MRAEIDKIKHQIEIEKINMLKVVFKRPNKFCILLSSMMKKESKITM